MFRVAVHVSPAPQQHKQNRWFESGSYDPAKVTATGGTRALAGLLPRRKTRQSSHDKAAAQRGVLTGCSKSA